VKGHYPATPPPPTAKRESVARGRSSAVLAGEKKGDVCVNSQPASISCQVVAEYYRAHTGLPRAALAHEEDLLLLRFLDLASRLRSRAGSCSRRLAGARGRPARPGSRRRRCRRFIVRHAVSRPPARSCPRLRPGARTPKGRRAELSCGAGPALLLSKMRLSSGLLRL